MEAVLVALIVGVLGIVGQWVLRRQGFQRQDQVAERVAEAARLLLESNEEVAKTAKTAARTAADTQSQLHQIHDLVNSNLTAAIRDSYTSKVGHLAALRERESVLAESGKPPTPGAARVMRELQASIDELGTTIADRLDATKVAARSAEG